MSASSPRLANAFLRYASPFAGLRHVPVLGEFLRRTSRELVSPETLIWVQIEQGPAAGLWVRLNPRTGRDVLRGGGETGVQRVIARYLQPGMVFYDLGANIGFFSLIAARMVGSAGRVYSFEADPEVAGRLRENLEYNDFPYALVEEKAVWSESGTVPFARVDASSSADRGLGHVAPTGAGSRELISVRAVSLDDFCASHPAPNLLKCDVEGAECEVFRGASHLLADSRPAVICEMHSQENHWALTRKFVEFGYDCRSIDQNHILAVRE